MSGIQSIKDAQNGIRRRKEQIHQRNIQIKDCLNRIEKLKLENARLREALEVYADINNWKLSKDRQELVFNYPDKYPNSWEIAEKALEKSK
jgi:regulator of replication initiation timing